MTFGTQHNTTNWGSHSYLMTEAEPTAKTFFNQKQNAGKCQLCVSLMSNSQSQELEISLEGLQNWTLSLAIFCSGRHNVDIFKALTFIPAGF
jgi:hypothetical protein